MHIWQIAVDTGGTFTDCLASHALYGNKRIKVLSNGTLIFSLHQLITPTQLKINTKLELPADFFQGYDLKIAHAATKVLRFDAQKSLITVQDQLILDDSYEQFVTLSAGEQAPILAARMVTGTRLNEDLPAIKFNMGSTKGTNALLEQKGDKVALLVTKGFKDILLLGTQQRPDLFCLDIKKRALLPHTILEIEERIDATGAIIQPLSRKEVLQKIKEIKLKGYNTIAVSLINAFVNPLHEVEIKNLCISEGIRFISLGSALFNSINYLPRTETTLANAYLTPIIKQYINEIDDCLHTKSRIHIMSSAGGLLPKDKFFPKDSLLSGPAGGMVGAEFIGKQCGIAKFITLDIGGTSTDVSRYHQRFEYRYNTKVGNAQVLAPCIAIETVAAGGGSICDFDGKKFIVGPHSAGAFPGPACYGNGGPLCITDINLLCGRIQEDLFGIPLSRGASVDQMTSLFEKCEQHLSKEELLLGLLQIANEKMANAILEISLNKGYDVQQYALLGFGGAGGLHVCDIADILHIEKIVIPYDAGILSALGIGNAPQQFIYSKSFIQPVATNDRINELVLDCIDNCERNQKQLMQFDLKEVLLHLRYEGQENTLEITHHKHADTLLKFTKEYQTVFAHFIDTKNVELESIKLVYEYYDVLADFKTLTHDDSGQLVDRTTQTLGASGWVNTRVVSINQLSPKTPIHGPAVILNETSTTYLKEGWQAETDSNFNLICTKRLDKKAHAAAVTNESLELELYTNRFKSIAEQMGALLLRSSFSVNIKDRKDFSCAILDENGNLVVNAPHIPVHLGAISYCVRSVLKLVTFEEGDVLITNDPQYGGSHLPDVTLIAPIFYDGQLIAYVANRAHHAEIGGKAPGSMPADAKSLSEEGVVIKPFKLIEKGKSNLSRLEKTFSNHEYPSRSVSENMADVNAALASLSFGKKQLLQLCDEHGGDQVALYIKKLYESANDSLSQLITSLKDKTLKSEEFLDDGSKIAVTLSTNLETLLVDFAGTSGQHRGNLNAGPGIVASAVIYVLRLLCSSNIPLNDGLMERVKIKLPKKSFINPDFNNDPKKSPAVVGGNVETSQRIVDTLLKAFNIVACSQGTMNNLLFGNTKYGYYETICGGTGAGNGFHGCDGVHQHMTNTKITDPEILENRYPVRLVRFAIRKHSGGKGKWHGGNGILREIMFLEPTNITILSQHRLKGPYGINGGEPGQVGEQYILAVDGEKKNLAGIDKYEAQKGDSILIKTPGGGGFGVFSEKN